MGINLGESRSHSASFTLRLRVNGCTFAASKVGHDRIVLVEATPLPDGPAEVIAIVDGHEQRWPVAIEDRHQARKVVPVTLRPAAP